MKTKNFQKRETPNNFCFSKNSYEYSNHLGNVLEVVTDRKLQLETFEGSGVLDYYTADVVAQSDYYPFGMLMPNRNESSSDYRYGFNGMEKDDEMTGGEGQSYDFGARLYNPRIGRFFSRDPRDVEYPWSSPYNYNAGKSPIMYYDFDGEGPIIGIGSPQQTTEVRAALAAGNYAEVYRIMYYGSTTEFVDESGNESEYIRNAAKKQLNIEIPKGQTLYNIGDAGEDFIEVRGLEMDGDGNLVEVSLGRFPDPFKGAEASGNGGILDELIKKYWEWERKNGADIGCGGTGAADGGAGGKFGKEDREYIYDGSWSWGGGGRSRI